MADDTSFSILTGNNVETCRVRAGGVIFREGEQADELFVIKSGYVRIQIGNRTMADLTTDNIFGEMALIDSEPRSATAREDDGRPITLSSFGHSTLPVARPEKRQSGASST